jgi:hypothetical protein
VRRGGGGWSTVALGFNTEEEERSERAGWAKWPHGADEAGLVREERWTRLQESLGRNRFGPPEKLKSFWNFFSTVLNLKPKLKFKSNTFSNSNKFKYFPKTEI